MSGESGGSGTPGPPPARRFREGGDGSYEEAAGYSRAVRRGSSICVSGTTARGTPLPASTYDQTLDCLRRVISAVEALGGDRGSILRTRIYLAPGADWSEASAAHRELLGEVAPANTLLYVGALVGTGLLVEVEADAEVLA